MRILILMLLVVLVSVLLLFGCALLMIWIPLPHPLPAALSNERNLLAAVLTGGLGMALLAGITLATILMFLRAGRDLEPYLAPAGFTVRNHLLFGRKYAARIRGREVEVEYLPPSGVRLAMLNVYVNACFQTKVSIGYQRPLLDCRDCRQLAADRVGIEGLQVYAQREDYARSLLADERFKAALQRLMGGGQATMTIYFQPDRVWLRVRPRRRVVEEIGGWVEDLVTMAEADEQAAGLIEGCPTS